MRNNPQFLDSIQSGRSATLHCTICYCTIVDYDHLHRAVALARSIQYFNPAANLYVLCTDFSGAVDSQIILVPLSRLRAADPLANDIATKYRNAPDELRWSLKGIYISYIIDLLGSCNIIYCDSDFSFFSYPIEIAEYLSSAGVVLTPHWRPERPPPLASQSKRDFQLNFLHGLFNAGFVAANELGRPALIWWSELCLDACENNHEEGLYHDQRYLDLMPIYFPEVAICRHRGYNIAHWNLDGHAALHRRTADGRDPNLAVRAIHFTTTTLKRIDEGSGVLLEIYCRAYRRYLSQAMNEIELLKSNALITRIE